MHAAWRHHVWMRVQACSERCVMRVLCADGRGARQMSEQRRPRACVHGVASSIESDESEQRGRMTGHWMRDLAASVMVMLARIVRLVSEHMRTNMT